MKGEHNAYLNPHLAIIPNTKIKKIEYTHTIILNIKKDKKHIPKKNNEKRKNMKKNHINLAHLNKWSDSLASSVELPSIATQIATGRRTKKNICENRVWSRYHSYYRKLWKTIKKSKVCEKPKFGSESRLRVGKVLAPHNVRPNTVPLIKYAKVMWFFEIFNFPQN